MNKKFNFPPSVCTDCWRLSHKECPEGYTEPSKSRIACKNHIKDNKQTTILCRDCMRDYLGNCPETSDTQCEVIRGNIECKSYYKRNKEQMNEQQMNDICTGCFRMTSKECTGKEFKSIHGTGGDTICFNYKLPPNELNTGVKYDGDKPLVALVFGGFVNAISDCDVYEDNNEDIDNISINEALYKLPAYNGDKEKLTEVTCVCIQYLQKDIIIFSDNKKYKQDKITYWGRNYDALISIAQVGSFGAKKYAENNWMGLEDGEKRTLNAAMRHIMAYMSGEINNHEEFEKDGVKYTCDLPHLGHAAWELLACIEFARYRLGMESTVKEAQDKLCK